jgi:mono/diheme cytochrome c family protein
MVGVRHLPIVIALGVAALSACSAASPPADRSAATTTPEASTPENVAPETAAPDSIPGESEGARVFRAECAGCHGTHGEGELGPSLVGIASRLSVADQVAIVRQGKARMPPFQGGLSDADIAAVVVYTRTQLR